MSMQQATFTGSPTLQNHMNLQAIVYGTNDRNSRDRSRGKTLFIVKEDNLRFICICPEETVDELDNDFDDIFNCN